MMETASPRFSERETPERIVRGPRGDGYCLVRLVASSKLGSYFYDTVAPMKKIAFLIALTLGCSLALADPIVKCSDITAMSFGSEVKIESATLAPANARTPENCDVRGTIWPEAKFALKLPTAWNKRFQMVGNGGTAGVLSIAAVDTGVSKGYATVSTDTGHDAAKEPLATFARP